MTTTVDGVLQESVEELQRLGREQLIQRVVELQDHLAKLNEQFQIQQVTDALTGLANRDYFFASLTRLWRRARRFNQTVCLALVDVDDFRGINERFGHLAGDLVLTGLADTLRAVVRDYDLLARFGEEEFAIAIDNGDPQNVKAWAERIRNSVAQLPVCANDRMIPATVTVGMALGQPEVIGDKPETLVHAAIEACELARRKGHNQFHCITLDKPA